ncbi:hypothetical protein [Acinetobacter bereziniae]|nr:hypothetical protein [Acinetobacter bereziniae]MCV2445294.1 hypothetical protein [Acinetobacter bereziniae]
MSPCRAGINEQKQSTALFATQEYDSTKNGLIKVKYRLSKSI